MKTSKKKTAIVTGSIIALIAVLLAATPYLFKDQIINAILSEAGKHIKANVKFSDVSFSLIRNFPDLRVSIEDVTITGNGSFKGDTLADVESLNGVIELTSLWSDDGYNVKEIILDKPNVHLITDKNGKHNWDIIKKEEKKDEKTKPFRLKLKKLKINDGKITYDDYKHDVFASIDKINHKLSGNFAEEMNDFQIENEWGKAYLKVGKIVWLNNYNIKLDAKFTADTKNDRYELSDNKLEINEVKLALNGWFKAGEKGLYDMDLKLDANECRLKDILSLVPAIYTNKFDDIEAKGTVLINGYAKGELDTRGKGTKWPEFEFDIRVKDGWFKYPTLPKSVSNININSKISNKGGSIVKTVFDISQFSLTMGDAPFTGRLRVTNPETDPNIDLYAKGKLNLSQIKEFYPLKDGEQLEGNAELNLNINGKMSYYKQKQYDRFKFDGNLTVANMKYNATSLSHPIQIKYAKMNFTSKHVDVPELSITVGSSDLTANGYLDNIVSYFLRGDTLKGTLNTTSSFLNISDLLTTSNKPATKTQSGNKTAKKTSNTIAVPTDINIGMTSTFKHIVFDKINITNARGRFDAQYGKLKMTNISLNALGGSLNLDGEYDSSNPAQPTLKGDVDIKDVLYSEAFRQIKSAQKLVPIFGKTKGRFHGNAKFTTPLGDDMKPDLTKLKAKGSISSNDITISGVEALHKLSKILKRDEFYDPNIKQVTIPFEVKDGKVHTDDFSFNVADTKFNIEKGYTGIDKSIDYTMHLDEQSSETTIIKLSKIGVRITGTMDNPKVKVQTKEMVKEAGRTIKSNVTSTVKQATSDMKEEWKAEKEDMKEEWKNSKENVKSDLKEAGSEIKNTFKSLFKRNSEND